MTSMDRSHSAAAYLRISEDHQDGAGVARQRQACLDLAQKMGLTLEDHHVYVDNDISAYSGKHRPGFVALQDAMAAGDVGAVLAYAPDRISRDVVEMETFRAGARVAGVRLVYVLGGESALDDPNADLFSTVSAAVSRWESSVKSKRVAAAARQRAESGRPPAGVRRYGYRSVPGDTGRWEVVEHEAREFRRCVENVLAGQSVRSQVVRLNGLGEDYWTPARRSRATGELTRNPWDGRTLARTLVRPDAAGLVVYKGEVLEGITGQWEPIITPELHRAIVLHLTDPKRRTNSRPGRQPTRLGTQLYACGGTNGDGTPCDGLMKSTHQRNRDGSKKLVYECKYGDRQFGRGGSHMSRAMVAVDDYVTSAVLARLARGDVQAALAQAQGEDTGALYTERSRLEQEIRDLGAAHGRGAVTLAQMIAATEGLNERLAAVNRQLEGADRSGVLHQLPQVDATDPEAAKVVADWWFDDDTTLDIQRAVVDAVLTVTILPSRRGGRNPGFDTDSVRLDWKV